MTDEMDSLVARARELEKANALLRSMQSPSGRDTALREENAVLRGELGLVRRKPGPDDPPSDEADLPGTLAEFNALPPARREGLARRMTRRQRDDLIGRSRSQERNRYL